MTWALVGAMVIAAAVAIAVPGLGLGRIDPPRHEWSKIPRLSIRRTGDPVVGEQLPATLELLAACLDSGTSIRSATAVVAEAVQEPTRELLIRVERQFAVGRGAPDAWQVLAEEPWWGTIARDVSRSARSGLPLSRALISHAEEARRQREAERTKVARSVGVRAVVPLMVCFLPAFVLVGVVPMILGLLRGFIE